MIKKVLGSALEYGDKGANVEKAQEMLQAAGSKIKVNGLFTIGMTTAVKCFQRKNKLKETGIIDNKTWEKLIAVSSSIKTLKKAVKAAEKLVKKNSKK